MTFSIQNTVFLIHCVSWAKLRGRVLFLQVLFECCYACKKRKSQKEQCWHQRLTTSSVQKLYGDTVDGSDIRRSPVEEMVVYPMIYAGLCTSLVLGLGISEPPTVFTLYIGRSYTLYLIYVLFFCHTCFFAGQDRQEPKTPAELPRLLGEARHSCLYTSQWDLSRLTHRKLTAVAGSGDAQNTQACLLGFRGWEHQIAAVRGDDIFFHQENSVESIRSPHQTKAL